MFEGHDFRRRRIAVAIPTYRRQESLAKLLGVLGERAAELSEGYEVTAIIVDNDPDGSARGLVTEGTWAVPVSYAHEPTPGIAAARSRLLREAVGHHLLVFIDDDEWPMSGWLVELVSMWERTRAAAVFGRVETVLPAGTDPWVDASGIFKQPKRLQGQRLPGAATNNLLLDLGQVRAMGIDFDQSLGLRGGEDTLFTRHLVALGGTILACPLSVVRDELDPKRATRSFVLQRSRYRGITQADVDLRLAVTRSRRMVSRARSTAKSVLWFGRGIAHWAPGVVTGSLDSRASAARSFQRSRGLIEGAWTKPRGEYDRAES